MKISKSIVAFGVALLSLTTISSAGNVFADDTPVGTEGTAVKMGDVDKPVYTTNVTWGDMTFGYKFNNRLNQFHFEPSVECERLDYIPQLASAVDGLRSRNNLYKDSNCSQAMGAGETASIYYFKKATSGNISVFTSTTNGVVGKVTASFTANSKYNWVNGKFVSVHGNSIANEGYDEGKAGFIDTNIQKPLTNGELEITMQGGYAPGMPNNVYFGGYLMLDIDSTKPASNNMVKGDEIGNVTVTIYPGTL